MMKLESANAKIEIHKRPNKTLTRSPGGGEIELERVETDRTHWLFSPYLLSGTVFF